MISRSIFILALLWTVASARAVDAPAAPPIRYVDVAANLEVTVANGSATFFKGFTDDHGHFETTPLEPGVYTFQLRIPKTMITPARYTLAVSGARPLGDALVGPGVALGMNVQVRRLGTVRGLVSGRRATFVAPTSTTTGGATSAPTVIGSAAGLPVATSLRGIRSPAFATSTQARPAGAVTASARATSAPVAASTSTATTGIRATSPRTGIPSSTATTLGPQPQPARAVATSAPAAPALVVPPISTASASVGARTAAPSPRSTTNPSTIGTTTSAPVSPAATVSTARNTIPASPYPEPRPVGNQARIINGRPHVWVPIAAGSNLGYWVPQNASPQIASPARAPSPSPSARKY